VLAFVASLLSCATTKLTTRQGLGDRFTRSAGELRAVCERSAIKVTMLAKCKYLLSAGSTQDTAAFQAMATVEANPRLNERSVTSAGSYIQVKIAVIQQFQIIWAKKATLFLKQGSTTVQA
jgi:hypothetical protein